MNTTNPKSKIQNPQSAAGLRPPQFGLRTLLLVVAACAALLALRQWLSPIAVAALAFLAAAIFLHIAGNAIGTQLRAIGDQPETRAAGSQPHRQPRAEDFAPATRLSVRQSLGWPILAATVTGAVLSGIGGGIWTALASHAFPGLLNIAVGVVAFSVLGGLAAFGVVALVQVLTGAIWQALCGTPAAQDRE